MTIHTNTAAARALHAILDGIAREDSPQAARDAALALRTAVVEGRIDGMTFFLDGFNPGCACVIGHIADVLGVPAGHELPGWTMTTDDSPVERLMALVRPGDRPATTPELAELLGLVDTWLAERGEAVTR